MPRISRRIKRRRRPSEYTPRHILDLTKGHHDWFGDLWGGAFPTKTEAWAELRDEILPGFITEHPGTRPHAWWLYDAPGRRERTDGGVHPFDRADYPEHLKRLLFGKPCRHETREDAEAEFETEEAFLRRHDLLTKEEIDAPK